MLGKLKQNFIDSYNLIKNQPTQFFNFIQLKFNELAEKEKKVREDLEKNNNLNNDNKEENKENIINDKITDINDFINLDFLKYTPKIIDESTLTLTEKLNNSIKLQLTNNDVYNILSELYKKEFKMINYSKYNLENERKKIDELNPLIQKLISSQKNKKMEITKKEVEDLYKLLENNEGYCNIYFDELSFLRTHNLMIDDVFNINEKIFKIGLDHLLKKMDYDLMQLLVTSQSYYRMNDNKKEFIFDKIKNHEIFQNEHIFVNLFFSQSVLPTKLRIYDPIENKKKVISIKKIKKNDKDLLDSFIISFM